MPNRSDQSCNSYKCNSINLATSLIRLHFALLMTQQGEKASSVLGGVDDALIILQHSTSALASAKTQAISVV